LEELAEQHPKKCDRLLAVADDRERHLSTINFVRVSSETFAAVLITIALSRLLDGVWLTLVIAAVAITLLSFMLVGVSPRMIGSSHATRLVRWSVSFVRGLRLV